MANAEFEQLKALALEVEQEIVYMLPDGTGFSNADKLEGLLRQHGFLTPREEEKIDRANAKVHRSNHDYEKSLEEYTRHILRQKEALLTPKAIVQEKKIIRTNFPRAKYEEAIPWFNWYKEVEPFMPQSQVGANIAYLDGWIIIADKKSRGLIITQPHKNDKETSIYAPSFRGSNDDKPFPVFCSRSSRFEPLDGIVRASYTELWYILVEHVLLSPPHQTDVQKAIEEFLKKQQPPKTA